jgi:hypothetical protein
MLLLESSTTMASKAQLDANRRNSQKSTGPRSEAGKAASSQNSTRSGVYANSLLIYGEDPAELDALAREYLDTCRPVGPRERAVVDALLHADWLLRRMRRVETEGWNSAEYYLRKAKGDEYDEDYTVVNVYARIEDRLDRIQRRITTLERLYHRRLAELERLQSRRPSASAPNPEPIPAAVPEIGFVPSNPTASSSSGEPDDSPARSAGPVPGPRPLTAFSGHEPPPQGMI